MRRAHHHRISLPRQIIGVAVASLAGQEPGIFPSPPRLSNPGPCRAALSIPLLRLRYLPPVFAEEIQEHISIWLYPRQLITPLRRFRVCPEGVGQVEVWNEVF